MTTHTIDPVWLMKVRAGYSDLTRRELALLWDQAMDLDALAELHNRGLVKSVERLREQRKQRRIRAFGRKRLLLKAFRPLVKLTARMEGRG